MTKLTTATIALLLAGSLTACSKDTGAASTPAAPAASASSAPSAPSTSDATGTDPTATGSDTPTASGTASTSAAPVTVDQSTPEAAMTSWLGAMVAGQGQTVCDGMAIKGQPIKDIEGAAKACGEKITPMLEKITALGGAADPLVGRADLQEWNGYTTGDFAVRTFEGEHFYTTTHLPQLAESSYLKALFFRL